MLELMPFLNEISFTMSEISIVSGLILACFITAMAIYSIRRIRMPMPGVRCPRCLERGVEQWVLPGKHCPRCNYPC